jgi:hypothetical protein
MPDDTTTGIRNPDKPGHWLVPPWPADASFNDVVRHFLRFHPWGNTKTAHLLAYFEGYEAALDAASIDQLASEHHQRWCADVVACIRRCARLYRDKYAIMPVGRGRPGERGSVVPP